MLVCAESCAETQITQYWAKITTPHGGVVLDVPCRVYLPPNAMGRPYLEFDLTEDQTGPLTVPEFSAEGRAETPNGVVSIRSDIVLTQGWSAQHWGSKFIKCTLPGEPWDFGNHQVWKRE